VHREKILIFRRQFINAKNCRLKKKRGDLKINILLVILRGVAQKSLGI